MDFFLAPPDLKSALARFAIVTAMLALFIVLYGTAEPTVLLAFLFLFPFEWCAYIWPLLPQMLAGQVPATDLVFISLKALQALLALGVLRVAIARFIPGASSWSLFGEQGDYLDISRLRRGWWTVPVTMAFLALYTLYLGLGIASRLQGVGTHVMSNLAGGWPLWTSYALGLVGFLWALRFNESARTTVSRLLDVQMLPGEHPLTQRVHGFADQLGLPRPAVGVMGQANAFAVGPRARDAAVILGVPLIDALEPDELDAVIGHELGHIASGDMRQMLIAMGFQDIIGKVSSFAVVVGTFLAAGLAKKKSSSRRIHAVGSLVERLVGGMVFTGGELMSKSLSRRREYFADAVGAALASPDAMNRALARLQNLDARPTPEETQYAYLMFHGFGGWRPFATHPTTAQRQQALARLTYINALPRR